MACAEDKRIRRVGRQIRDIFPVLLLCSFVGCTHYEPDREHAQRIISLAPSTTEILFALGLGDRVVGVTRYCNYPPSTSEITRVGGYVDLNYEEIVLLRPDLTVLLTSHRDAKAELEQMGIRTLSTPHETIADIHQTIRMIGNACDRKDRAKSLLDELARRTQAVRDAVDGKQRPRVLICIGRDTQSGQMSGLYIAGRHGLYDEIIEMAGGVNAYQEEAVAYPQVSAEGVINMDPDVIIEIVSDVNPDADPPTGTEIKQHWEQLRTIKAVREGQVHVVLGTHALHPGPRYVEFLEQVARLLHPDCFFENDVHD